MVAVLNVVSKHLEAKGYERSRLWNNSDDDEENINNISWYWSYWCGKVLAPCTNAALARELQKIWMMITMMMMMMMMVMMSCGMLEVVQMLTMMMMFFWPHARWPSPPPEESILKHLGRSLYARPIFCFNSPSSVFDILVVTLMTSRAQPCGIHLSTSVRSF